jgi:Tol biopolymer transport system component
LALTPGTRLGVYEVTAQIGAGGMGEVYRATDSNLKRSVAIKVLAASVAGDADRLARFQREAEMLAAVNHPNIAAIYGLEKTPDFTALVMELVEGDDLSQRIARGAIPLDEALPIAKQIAEALEAAHEQNIIHRDLKPANIRMRSDGTVKVLDFGLAKAGSEGMTADLTHTPTMTVGGTRDGLILGTAAYMSPEQARGQAVDKRTDIWAFGCVLFEMLTSRGAFEGRSISDTIANILKTEPHWDALPEEAAALEPVLRRCVEKDLKRRLRDIGDVRLFLDDAVASASDIEASRRKSARSTPLWQLAAAAAAGAAIAGSSVALLTRVHVAPESARVQRFQLGMPADRPLDAGPPGENIAISPDGSRLVYSATRGGVSVLVMRHIDRLDVEPVAGSEEGFDPAFSPDGQHLMFSTFKELREVDASGGPSVSICAVDAYFSGASWAPDNSIVFAQLVLGLFRTSSSGRAPEKIAAPDPSKQERSYTRPLVLPNGAILYTAVLTDGTTRIMARRAGDHDATTVLADGFDPHYVSSGHLVYGQRNRLVAVRFNPSTLKASGTPVPVQDGVFTKVAEGVANVSFGADGTAAFISGRHAEAPGAILWLDPTGTRVGQAFVQRLDNPRNLRLSRDGHRLALVVGPGGLGQLWVYTLDGSAQPLKLTFGDHNLFPVWSPDDRQIAFMRRTNGESRMMVIPSDGSDIQPKVLTDRDEEAVPWTWSPDGAFLLFRKMMPPKLWLMHLPDGKASPWLQTPFLEASAAFSPDGRWIAYSTNQTGADEIWVRPFPGPGTPTRVSDGGGERPIWKRDGKEIYFENHGKMVSARVASQSSAFRSETPRVVFDGGFMHDDTDANLRFIDAVPDGRFIAVEPEQASGAASIVVVQHWEEELKRLVPTK